jgi:hypothetical protein
MWIEFDWHKIWSNGVLMRNKCSGSIKERKFLTSLTANRFSRTLCHCSYLIYFVFIVIDMYEAKWNLATWRHLYAGWNNYFFFLILLQITRVDQECNLGQWLSEELGSVSNTSCCRGNVLQGVWSRQQCHYWRRNRYVACVLIAKVTHKSWSVPYG